MWKDVKCQDFEGFFLRDRLYEAGSVMPRHSHDAAHISFVLGGGFDETYGRKRRENFGSALILHPPGEEHSVWFQEQGARIFSVNIKPEFYSRIQAFTKVMETSVHFSGGGPSAIAAQLYSESKEVSHTSPLMYESLVLEILSTAVRTSTFAERTRPTWLDRAIDHLHANFHRPMTIDEIASAVDIHPMHLTRVFREKHNCTIGEYVRRLRVEYARHQISATDSPLSEIALAAGFADQSHLCRTFKAYVGTTALKYRKKNTRKSN